MARLYRRSLTDQGFGPDGGSLRYCGAAGLRRRSQDREGTRGGTEHPIGRSLASCASPPWAYRAEGVSRSRRRGGWKRAVEMKMGEAGDRELPAEVAWSLLAQVLAESRLRTADSNLRRWLRLLQE